MCRRSEPATNGLERGRTAFTRLLTPRTRVFSLALTGSEVRTWHARDYTVKAMALITVTKGDRHRPTLDGCRTSSGRSQPSSSTGSHSSRHPSC
jgi:hypothetical protein